MSHPLISSLQARLPETLHFLRSLVDINSHFDNADGVNENARRIIAQFSPLGFQSHRALASVPGRGEHLFLDSGGKGPAIALVAHLDTVFTSQEEELHDFHWQEAPDGRIFGPGTLDIKGGTALIWLMLATLAEESPELFRSVRWILAWNAEEEAAASRSFGAACLACFPKDLLAALVFEADNAVRDEGISLLNARKGSAVYRVEVAGRGAHAGARHGDGANAIWQLARIVDRLQGMTDDATELTINVGSFHGGKGANRVPHEAVADLQVRAYDRGVFEAACAKIEALAGVGEITAARDGYPCTVTVKKMGSIGPWPQNEQTDRLLSFWKKAGERLGLPVTWHPRGGVSDGNHLARHFPALDALGPAGANTHASERSPDGAKEPEFVYAPSFVPKAAVNLTAIRLLVDSVRRESNLSS
ncbi:MAG TPA: M20/M25/M40 family metallo-hydrolase [Chthoniobacteraceae bacterium]|nr:M20/M25/M40 family metallo-hydrolase [Chthoniobacteraceae bacterium]